MQPLPSLREGWPQEEYPNRVWDFSNTPFYLPVDDRFLLIGITHSDFVGSITANTFKTFTRTIKGIDNLIMEGSEQIHALNRENRSNGFEQKALREFAGRPIFLDDGKDHLPELASKGVAEQWVAAYKLLKNMHALIGGLSTINSFKAKIGLFNNLYKKTTLRFKTLDQEYLELITAGLAHLGAHKPSTASQDIIGDLLDISDAFHHYYGRFRDSAFFGPELLKYHESLKGKTGVLVGAGHLETLARALTTGATPPLLHWGAYLSTYFPRLLDAQASVEEVVWSVEDHLGRPRTPSPIKKTAEDAAAPGH